MAPLSPLPVLLTAWLPTQASGMTQKHSDFTGLGGSLCVQMFKAPQLSLMCNQAQNHCLSQL